MVIFIDVISLSRKISACKNQAITPANKVSTAQAPLDGLWLLQVA